MKLKLMIVSVFVFAVVSAFGSASHAAENRHIQREGVEKLNCALREAKELIQEVQNEQTQVETGSQIKAN